MSTMKAIKVFGTGDARLVEDAKIPTLRDDCILVKTHSVALNPPDCKYLDEMPSPGATVGCDYAGIVIEVGSKVTKSFKPGDRVCGAVCGNNALQTEDRAFGEYVVAKGDLQMKIPEHLGFEEASTLGLAVVIAGQGLCQGLGLPLPNDEEERPKWASRQILIHGGNNPAGMMAIQYAALYKLIVNTTAPPNRFDLVLGLGADYAYSYYSEICGIDINKNTDNELHYVFDTISTSDSIGLCWDALSDEGNNFYAGYPTDTEPSDPMVNTSVKVPCSAQGEEVAFGEDGPWFAASQEDFEFAKKFVGISEKLLQDSEINPLRMKIGQGGLNGVLEGMNILGTGKPNSKKLVYRVDETQ